MNDSKSALQRGEEALSVMLLEGSKISKNSVAKRAGFNHTNFYKAEFADLRNDIENAALEQKKNSLTGDIDKLKEQLLTLKSELKVAKAQIKDLSTQDKNDTTELMIKLMECYRLNDKLAAENTNLKSQLIHSLGEEKQIRINSETGEVMTGVFKKT